MIDRQTLENALQVCLSVADLSQAPEAQNELQALLGPAQEVRDALLRASIVGMLLGGHRPDLPHLTCEEQLQILGLLVTAKETLSMVAAGEGKCQEARLGAEDLLGSIRTFLEDIALRAQPANAQL